MFIPLSRIHSQHIFIHTLRSNCIKSSLTRRTLSYSHTHNRSFAHRRMTLLKYLLVLDFEATCGDAVSCNEIIEFPTLVYDLKEKKVQATFHEYVRPVIHPTLTEFCTNLTGIVQVRRFAIRFRQFLAHRRTYSILRFVGHCGQSGHLPSGMGTLSRVLESTGCVREP